MDPKTFLDQPIKAICPSGWRACFDCGKYFNHQAVYCPTCGRKIVAWTEATISDYLKKTANQGSAMINEIYFYLKELQGAEDIFFEPLTPENQAIYDQAKEIWEQAQKKQE